MAIKIAIANQKGGIGKTTTSINLADALKHFNYRVLVVDIDPQCNTTNTYGAVYQGENSIVDVLNDDCKTSEAIQHLPMGDIIPGDEILSGEMEHFNAEMGREKLLKRKLSEIEDDYDFVIMDTPPSLGLYMINALAAADGCIIPLQAEKYAKDGLKAFFETVKKIRASEINTDLKVYGILVTKYDARNGLDKKLVETDLPKLANEYNCKGFDAVIRISQDVKNAQDKEFEEGEEINRSLFDNYRNSNAAKDYVAFVKELLEVISNGQE